MRPLRLSYSSRGVAASCWRRFEFRKRYPKIQRPWEDTFAMDVGKALHAGYQNYLIHRDVDKATWELMKTFPWEGEFGQPNDYRNFEACMSTLDCMMDSVALGDYELAQILRPNTPEEIEAGLTGGVTVPAIEVPFAIRFEGLELADGTPIEFIGYIDAIMRKYGTSDFRSMDIKTTRMKLNDSTAKFMFDAQQLPYGLVIDHIAGGTQAGFEVLYLDSYIDLLDPTATPYTFNKSAEDVQEWIMDTVTFLEQLIQYDRDQYFPRASHGCLFYNKPCQYLNICHSRDKDALLQWLTLDGEIVPDSDDDFMPWITATIDLKGIV